MHRTTTTTVSIAALLLSSGCGIALSPEVAWRGECPAGTRPHHGREVDGFARPIHVVGCELPNGTRVGRWYTRGETFDETVEYVNGVRHGAYRSIYIVSGDGREQRGVYENGERHGDFVDWSLLGSGQGAATVSTYDHGQLIRTTMRMAPR